MLGEICKYLNNYFVYDRANIHIGKFTISQGVLTACDLQTEHEALTDIIKNGQYFRIVGSVFNDGVYQYPVTGLTDEIFDGAIWAMSIPQDFFDLAEEIEDWCNSDDVKSAEQSPYTSESFGGYSYSKETGSDGSFSWQSHFAGKLAMWRKARINH